ncbi:MAG: DUF7659 family protein [Bacteroidales bacterium]
MKYQEIAEQQKESISEMFKDLGVFFAFSKKQFEENKTPLADDEKYSSIVGGGFLPSSNAEKFLESFDLINQTFLAQIKEHKQEEAHILYELYNHECFYLGNPSNAYAALLDYYPTKKIIEVYNKHRNAYNENN